MLQEQLDRALATVLRDVPPAVFNHGRVSAHAVTRGDEAAPHGIEPAEWRDADEAVVGILRIDENLTRLDAAGEAHLAAAIANLVQDAVIAEIGRPWPLGPDGCVLDVVVEHGTATWWDRRTSRVPVGELRA